jgi:hypothetical protein
MSGFVGRFDEPQAAAAMSTYADLTPEAASRALREAGLSYPAGALDIAAREERWVVSLSDGHIAWFAALSRAAAIPGPLRPLRGR